MVRANLDSFPLVLVVVVATTMEDPRGHTEDPMLEEVLLGEELMIGAAWVI